MKIPQMFYLRRLVIKSSKRGAPTTDAVLYVFHNYRKTISGVVQVPKTVSRVGNPREFAKQVVLESNPEAEFWR